jgi:hypothetical protein
MGACVNCGEAFVVSADKSGKCKPCKRAYGRQHYLENKEAYVAKASKNKFNAKLKNYQQMNEYLASHPCLDCGESDPLVLEFDHVGAKEADIAYLVQRRSWKRIMEEIEKCEVRCANCHRKVTAQRAGWLRFRIMGGSALIYQWNPATKTA